MEQRLLTAEEVRRALTDTRYNWRTEAEVDVLFGPHGAVDGDTVLEVMSALPLVALDADDICATLTFETARPLIAPEAWRLAMLGPDTPETIEPGQTKFSLWWD